jgi:hypothetical protein
MDRPLSKSLADVISTRNIIESERTAEPIFQLFPKLRHNKDNHLFQALV